MLVGEVTREGEAVVPVEILADGRTRRVNAAVDTGYNGHLTLPSAIIRELDLTFAGAARAELGDGTEVPLDLYLATIRWHDEARDVLVLSTDGNVLLGMMALYESRLTVDVIEEGRVVVEPL